MDLQCLSVKGLIYVKWLLSWSVIFWLWVTAEQRRGDPTQGHSGSRCIVVDPEGDPGENGYQDGRHVRLQDEVTDVPLQFEAEGQAGVGA